MYLSGPVLLKISASLHILVSYGGPRKTGSSYIKMPENQAILLNIYLSGGPHSFLQGLGEKMRGRDR